VGTNTGWVSVGTDHDTAAFAVNTIATWWRNAGKTLHPNASRLLICADGGGSNSYRYRLWKAELAAFAADNGLTITVCHLPPGTSNRVGGWRGDAVRAFRFQPPPPRSVHAVLPHTAHRRRSPPAFGLPRQSRKGLGATTFPERLTRPRWFGEA
jgi:Rhodopirellula transposase DDE domain